MRKRKPKAERFCRACNKPIGTPRGVYCLACRLARRKQEFAARCLTPGCGERFFAKARDLHALLVWEDKFCPACMRAFGNRLKALRLQVERGDTIHAIIIEAARAAFTDAPVEHRSFMRGFGGILGIEDNKTLHNWLRFFFGMTWPDFKRVHVCSSRACTLVDTSRVTATPNRNSRLVTHSWSKYYPVLKLREHGVCSCPVRGDSLVLVDLPAASLTPESLARRFQTSPLWIREIRVIEEAPVEHD